MFKNLDLGYSQMSQDIMINTRSGLDNMYLTLMLPITFKAENGQFSLHQLHRLDHIDLNCGEEENACTYDYLKPFWGCHSNMKSSSQKSVLENDEVKQESHLASQFLQAF
jgi:hypothetical protein